MTGGIPNDGAASALHSAPDPGRPRSQTGAQVSTGVPSNTGRSDAHSDTSEPSRSSAARTGAASRAASTDSGCTSPTRPPSRTRVADRSRNTALVSVYGPTPSTAASRVVAVRSWLRNGGLPTTTSYDPSGASASPSPTTTIGSSADGGIDGASSHSRNRAISTATGSRSMPCTHPTASATDSPVTSAIRRAAGTRNAPVPQAGSSTRTRSPRPSSGTKASSRRWSTRNPGV